MITLYVKTGCPYCAKAIAALKELHVPYEERNVADPNVLEELMQEGGKRQEPFLVDHSHNVAMYESDDIVAYLKKQFGTSAA